MKTYSFICGGRTYTCFIVLEPKRDSSIRYEFKFGKIYFYVSKFIEFSKIVDYIEKFKKFFVNRLILNSTIIEDRVIIFGEEYIVEKEGDLYHGGNVIYFIDEEELRKKLLVMLKNYMIPRIKELERVMNVPYTYKVSFKKMTSRWGSNSSRTHHLSFNISLVLFSKEIIDSVIFHELVHDRIRNHSKQFYDELLRYCPNYHQLTKKLNGGIFK